jgi:hypothetical protein
MYPNQCLYCGYKNRRGLLFCEECGHALVNVSDETARGSEYGEAVRASVARMRDTDRFDNETLLVLHIRDEAEPLVLSIGRTRLTIGRRDSKTNHAADIDLTGYGALGKGVSRLHAVVFRGADDILYLTDANSANGTFLNGHALPPHEAYPVSNGDEIGLGRLRMHAYFEKSALTTSHS